MDTSLRYGTDSKSLKIHAKQKFSVDSKTFIQARGELDTRIGASSYLDLTIWHFYPDLSASMGIGVQSNTHDEIGYFIRGKKDISLTDSGLFGIRVKGRCDTDKEFSKVLFNILVVLFWRSIVFILSTILFMRRKPKGAVELVWSILDFQRDQDMRIKVGYEISEKVPYVQFKENNWTLNADAQGKWNVRYKPSERMQRGGMPFPDFVLT